MTSHMALGSGSSFFRSENLITFLWRPLRADRFSAAAEKEGNQAVVSIVRNCGKRPTHLRNCVFKFRANAETLAETPNLLGLGQRVRVWEGHIAVRNDRELIV